MFPTKRLLRLLRNNVLMSPEAQHSFPPPPPSPEAGGGLRFRGTPEGGVDGPVLRRSPPGAEHVPGGTDVFHICHFLSKHRLSTSNGHALHMISPVSSPSLSGNKPHRSGFYQVGSEHSVRGQRTARAISLPTQLLSAFLPRAGKESTARRWPCLGLRHSRRRSRTTAYPWRVPRPPHPLRAQGLLSELGPSACSPEGSAQDHSQQRVRTSFPSSSKAKESSASAKLAFALDSRGISRKGKIGRAHV